MKKLILFSTAIMVLAYFLTPIKVTGSLYVVSQGARVIPIPDTPIKVYYLKEFREALYQKQNFANQQCMGLPDKSEVELAYLSGGPNRESAKANYDLIVACETATLIKEIKIPLVETVQTNKDGGFTLGRSRLDGLVLMAEGKRHVGLTTEEYLWLRVVPKDGLLSQKIEINNGNLVNNTDIRNIQL